MKTTPARHLCYTSATLAFSGAFAATIFVTLLRGVYCPGVHRHMPECSQPLSLLRIRIQLFFPLLPTPTTHASQRPMPPIEYNLLWKFTVERLHVWNPNPVLRSVPYGSVHPLLLCTVMTIKLILYSPQVRSLFPSTAQVP